MENGHNPQQNAFENLEIQAFLENAHFIADEMLSGIYALQRGAVVDLFRILIIMLCLKRCFSTEAYSLIFCGFIEIADRTIKLLGAMILFKVLRQHPDQVFEVLRHRGATTIVELVAYGVPGVAVEALRVMECASTLPLEFTEALIGNGAIRHLAASVEHLVEVLDNGFTISRRRHEITYIMLERVLGLLYRLCSIDPPLAAHMVTYLVLPLRRIILGFHPGPLDELYPQVCIIACFILLCVLRTSPAVIGSADGGPDRGAEVVQGIVNAEFCHRLTWLMQNTNQELTEAIHQIVRRFIWTSRDTIQVLIDQGLQEALYDNLSLAPEVQLEACKTMDLAIFFAPDRIQQIVFDGNNAILERLIEIINEPEIVTLTNELRVEAISVLAGVVRGRSYHQLEILRNRGCILLFCNYLNLPETSAYCIRALQAMLQVGDQNRVNGINEFVAAINHFGIASIHALTEDRELGNIADWIVFYLS